MIAAIHKRYPSGKCTENNKQSEISQEELEHKQKAEKFEIGTINPVQFIENKETVSFLRNKNIPLNTLHVFSIPDESALKELLKECKKYIKKEEKK